jgi:hypothetical protein
MVSIEIEMARLQGVQKREIEVPIFSLPQKYHPQCADVLPKMALCFKL